MCPLLLAFACCFCSKFGKPEPSQNTPIPPGLDFCNSVCVGGTTVKNYSCLFSESTTSFGRGHRQKNKGDAGWHPAISIPRWALGPVWSKYKQVSSKTVPLELCQLCSLCVTTLPWYTVSHRSAAMGRELQPLGFTLTSSAPPCCPRQPQAFPWHTQVANPAWYHPQCAPPGEPSHGPAAGLGAARAELSKHAAHGAV